MSSPDSTLVAIRKKVRRLTSSPSPTVLPDSEIDEYINTYYTQDFPYSIKIDILRYVYSFFTSPNIDTYTLDINSYQGIRAPIYVEGFQGNLYKSRGSFFGVWPRSPAKSQPVTGDGSTTAFSFTGGPTPFLRNNVVLGGTDTAGAVIQVQDDGAGNLIQVSDSLTIGTVNYVTGAISITFPVAPASGTDITLWVAPYQAGRPYDVLFWNNQFTVRPVPDNVYKVEVETFMTPTAFLSTAQAPTLNQWYQLIAIGASIKILQDRQDFDAMKDLVPLYDRQEALVLERQATETIGQANATIYNTPINNPSSYLNGWY